ncbi:MAG: insulinase family protein, partial [Alphaproteobacteria bacterium]|nr:insulinase family protein [Alphaproteobacteria bacterium]
MAIPVKITTLDNGLRVATKTLPWFESVSVGMWVHAGARDEEESENGLSHFLEHMAFKGTERRTALQIAEEFDAIGGHSNAYTSMEQTVYYTKVLKTDAWIAVDILADILQHSAHAEEEVAKERQVIVQEIAMHHDTPDDLVFDYFTMLAYPNQALGRSILGPEKLVSSFTRQQIIDYQKKHYSADRMVLAAAGNIEHEALVALAKEHFSGLTRKQAQTKPPSAWGGGVKLYDRELEQLHLVLGYDGVAYHDPRYYTLQMASTMLGGGMSSRLFQEVREKRGLAYSISTFVTSYADTGFFGVYTGTGEKESAEMVNVIRGELARFAASATDEELARTRTQAISSLRMSRESTSSEVDTLGRHLLNYG